MTREEAIGRLVHLRVQFQVGIFTREAIDMAIEALSKERTGGWIPCTKGGLSLTELGRREGQKWYGYKCSKCNFIYKGNALTESPFCQDCGAEMKGGPEDE